MQRRDAHVCPPQPPCYRCEQVIYPPEPWWVRLDIHLREGHWYGYGGLIPEFVYEKFGPKMYDPNISRTASITWLRQCIALTWTRERRM